MSNKSIPLPKNYLEKILKPVNKLTESCVLKGKGENLFTVCASEDKSVILYARLKLPVILEEEVKLNLIGVKKLLSGLDSLGNNGNFSLILGENFIKCQSEYNEEKTHFKYHLVDDSIIKEFPLKIEKITSISYDTEFELTTEKAKRILSASSFATEAQKVYFYLSDGVITADINDKTMQNIDNMVIPITNKWIGDELLGNFPISLEIFKNLVSLKENIKVKINNEFKVAIFNIIEDDYLELKYIVSSLIK
jgi:hypothetical protein